MAARTKGRAKFDFRGRPFLWWIDRDRYLRILSRDKKFIIAAPIWTLPGSSSVIEVIGPEFPGLDARELRPIRLVGPNRTAPNSLGEWVDEVLCWAFDPKRRLIRTDRNVDPVEDLDTWRRV
jgi:hypothetical protein